MSTVVYPSTSGTARVGLEQLAEWKSTNKPTKLGETGAGLAPGPLLDCAPPVCRSRSAVRVASCPQSQRRLPRHAPEGDTVRQCQLGRHQEAEPLVVAEVVRLRRVEKCGQCVVIYTRQHLVDEGASQTGALRRRIDTDAVEVSARARRFERGEHGGKSLPSPPGRDAQPDRRSPEAGPQQRQSWERHRRRQLCLTSLILFLTTTGAVP